MGETGADRETRRAQPAVVDEHDVELQIAAGSARDRCEPELTQGDDDVRAEPLLLPERLRFDLDVDGADALAEVGDPFDDLVPRTLDVDPQRDRPGFCSQHAVETHGRDGHGLVGFETVTRHALEYRADRGARRSAPLVDRRDDVKADRLVLVPGGRIDEVDTGRIDRGVACERREAMRIGFEGDHSQAGSLEALRVRAVECTDIADERCAEPHCEPPKQVLVVDAL